MASKGFWLVEVHARLNAEQPPSVGHILRSNVFSTEAILLAAVACVNRHIPAIDPTFLDEADLKARPLPPRAPSWRRHAQKLSNLRPRPVVEMSQEIIFRASAHGLPSGGQCVGVQ
jgi:hypothetical protein